MPSIKGKGKNKILKNGARTNKRKPVFRLLLVLSVLFVIVAAIAGIATYRVVSAYMADLPEFDPERFNSALTSFIYDKDGGLITTTMSKENRIAVTLDEISPHLKNAFIAIEDERFYDHPGFDLWGIMRAAYSNIFRRSAPLQGGSTITQQLVKNVFLDPFDRSIRRKLQELYLSFQMERLFTKDDILELYLNTIFFDQNAYGVEAAARTYFGKSAKDVTLAEAAILAGIPNLPGRFSPFRNISPVSGRNEDTIIRQRLILSRMLELGMITEAEAEAARAEEITYAERPRTREYPHSYFVDYVIQHAAPAILSELPEFSGMSRGQIVEYIHRGGFRIHTTMDTKLQTVVENTVNDLSLYPEREHQEEGRDPQPQAAVVVAQPQTGFVRALVGGRDTEDNVTAGFNRATQGLRQGGSVLKPILAYAPAFNEGIATTGTVVDDSPRIFQPPGGPLYFPNNYDRKFNGLVTLRYALAQSLNVPAVDVLDRLGIAKGREYAERMGITNWDPLDLGHSMVVGGLTRGISVYETAQAYAVLANNGVRVDFTVISKIEDRNGRTIYSHTPSGEVILSTEAAFLTGSALTDAVRYGTARRLNIGRPVAAKTGTGELARDAWMAAYTPDVVAAVWVGRDYWRDDTTMGRFQAFLVTPRFMNPIMRAAHEGLPVRDFAKPDTLREVTICGKSGLLPGPFCGDSLVTDYFLADMVPTETCNIHIQLEICTESGLLAGDFTPPHLRAARVFLNRPPFIPTDERWQGDIGRIPKDADLMPPTEYCGMHATQLDPVWDLRAEVNYEGVNLSWMPPEGAFGYLVYRSDGAVSVRLTAQPIWNTYYTDNSLTGSGSYTYQVFAVNSEGVRSSPAAVTVTANHTQPFPPPDSDEDSDDDRPPRNRSNRN